MPELPEVETFRKYFDSNALHHKIIQIKVEDTKLLRKIESKEFKDRIQGEQFASTSRIGKYLFAHLSNSQVMMIHFGMTGDLRYSPAKEPYRPHDRIIFIFENGFYLAYISQRKFGRIELWNSQKEFTQFQKLGKDALSIPSKEFYEKIHSSKRALKTILLDQKRVAGIGNLYADEALFQTSIHPTTLGVALEEKKCGVLLKNIQKILQIAIDRGAYYGQFPEDFFIHAREKDGMCPRCQNPLEHMKIAQRTTYFCPVCQKL